MPEIDDQTAVKAADMQIVFARPEMIAERVTHYCPGCGHGIAERLVAEVLEDLGLVGRAIGIASVGCSSFIYHYLLVDFVLALHGRAPDVGTAIKRGDPESIVFTYQGDGDLAAIGMGDIVHAAARGENLTVIFVNNTAYGMTGGQMAPTTLPGQRTTTTPLGRDPATAGHPIRVCEMLATLDGTVYAERVSVDSPAAARRAKKAITRAFEVQVANEGFSIVEVLSACPAAWQMDPTDSVVWQREHMTKVFPLGVYKDVTGQA